MSKLQRYRLVDESPQTSRLARWFTQLRSYTLGPLTSNSPELAKLWADQPSSSGIGVSETTALNYAAVWSAVNLIASDVASLPLVLYKRSSDGGKDRFPTHPLYRLLHDRPNPEMTSVVFRKALQAHVLTWGNGYAEIERDQADRPRALWLLTPDRVTPFRPSYDAPLQYRVVNPGGGDTVLDQRDMLHVPGLGWDGTQGYSVIHKARESIGLGVASERFGATFFGNGATFGGVLSFKGPKPTELSDKNYVDALTQKHQGVSRAHKILAVYNDATYSRLGIPPNDAQFLETRQFQITEIARWFNLPPHKIGDLTRATFSNIEQQSIDYYTTTLIPWLTVWEQELGFKLIASLEQNSQLIEHVADGLLRGDSVGRGASYTSQFQVGGITPDEVRASENRNKIKGGDRAFVPMNMVPLDRIDEIIDADIAAKKQPKNPAPAAPAADPNAQRDVERLTEELALARRATQIAEDARDVTASQLALEQQAHVSTREKMAGAVTREASARDGYQLEATARQQAVASELAITAERDQLAQRLVEAERATQTAEENRRIAEAALFVESSTRTLAATDHIADVQRVRDECTVAVAAAQQDIERANARATEGGQRVLVADAVVAELRLQVGTLITDLQARDAALSETREALARVSAQQAALETARATSAAAATSQAEEVTAARQWLASASTSIRAVVVDGLTWLIEREADRARRAQASPEKLQRWIESYYPGHDELCRKILRPSVRAWAACTGQTEPIDDVLDRFVAQHVEQSIRQLRSIADEHDVETLAPALEKVLRRWEADRADVEADLILRDAMGDVVIPPTAAGPPSSHTPDVPRRVRKTVKRDGQNRITEVIEERE